MVGCICQYRYVISVVGVSNCFCGVPSASFLCQLEAVFFDFINKKYIYIYVYKKVNLGLAKNYRGITLTSIVARIAAKILTALLPNHEEPKIEKILRKNQNGFWRNRSMMSQILTIRQIVKGVHAKNLEATILFVDSAKAFDSIHRGKIEQIPLAYGLFKEKVTAIMMLYRNMKVKVHSLDRDTDYFLIVAGMLLGDTLAPLLFIICLDYVLRMPIDKMKEDNCKLNKGKK